MPETNESGSGVVALDNVEVEVLAKGTLL